MSEVFPAQSARVFVGRDRASARGTWEIVGEQIADPINTVQIQCVKSTRTCEEYVASIASVGESHYLHLEPSSYQVLRWSSNEILAENDAETSCRHVLLRLNQSTNEVTQTITSNSQKGCETLGGESLPTLESPRVVRMVDGVKAAIPYYEKRRNEAGKGVSSNARRLIEEAAKQTAAAINR